MNYLLLFVYWSISDSPTYICYILFLIQSAYWLDVNATKAENEIKKVALGSMHYIQSMKQAPAVNAPTRKGDASESTRPA